MKVANACFSDSEEIKNAVSTTVRLVQACLCAGKS